jgi:HAD superfamily hydrolase (TIGR01509 family)
MIKAVVLDLDGLMFNTEEIFHEAGIELMRRHGREMTDEFFTLIMGRRAEEGYPLLVKAAGLDVEPMELWRESHDLFLSMLDEQLAPMPGLFELLDQIERSGLPKGVATSSDSQYLRRILTRFDILDRFHITLTAEDVTNGKPHPEIYLKAAVRLNVDPREMLVLEDSHNGSKAAAAAGAYIISVPHRHSRHQDFTHVRYVASSLIDPHVIDMLRRT